MRALTLLAACMLVSAPAWAQVVPTYLRVDGYAPGWATLSPDGSIVYHTGPTLLRLVWGSGGLTLEADLPIPPLLSVQAFSHDGSVAIGRRSGFPGPEGPTRWEDPLVETFPPEGGADLNAVSSDGSVIVGQAGSAALRWVNGVPMLIPGLPSGWPAAAATGVSADGSVVVGHGGGNSYDEFDDSPEAFRWEDGVTIGLGIVPGSFVFWSTARGVSADGRVVVGYTMSPNGIEAVRWEDGAIEALGDLPGGAFESQAEAASGDGSVIVGRGFRPSTSYGAFVWDSTHGMLDLELLLRHGYGVDTGLSETSGANAISEDGQIIAGWTSGGGRGLFVAAIPPSCDDSIDNDSDGFTDFPDDLGCFSADDRFEIASEFPCDDARDNDGDGLFDYPDDPGCASPFAGSESPACDDDVDNDGDGGVDWDGGSAGGPPDSRCVGMAWRASETTRACGLGVELPLPLAVIAGLLSRHKRRREFREKDGSPVRPSAAERPRQPLEAAAAE